MSVRYRCNACGNLTRFDVISRFRTKTFHHYTLGGDLDVEQVEELDKVVESVVCRWCQSGESVEELADDPPVSDGGGSAGDVASGTGVTGK